MDAQEHLLLLDPSPAQGPRAGWQDEVEASRGEIELRLRATLRRDLERRLPLLYGSARRQVTRKLQARGEGEGTRAVPETCPYTLDDVLGEIEPSDD